MIQINGISKEYRSGRGHVRALNDVSLTINKGATAALVGKSGSGKTTLLNCMGGLESPGSGTVACFGTNIHTLSAAALCRFQRRHVGFVFQHGNLLSYLTVSENIALPLTLNGIGGKEKTERIDELLSIIGLAGARAALPHELSGGELQRVAVARAVSHRPKLLLADEPTASLDSDTGRNLVRFMCDVSRDQGCTIVVGTHDAEIIDLADAVYHLRDGRIV